jgi:hypothetical protein
MFDIAVSYIKNTILNQLEENELFEIAFFKNYDLKSQGNEFVCLFFF